MLIPLKKSDFDALYKVASDPLQWAQHPNTNRYQVDVFQNFFDGAMQTGTAYTIVDKKTDEVIGSTRFYGYDEKEKSVSVGYTFISRSHWGKGTNFSVKKLMLGYAFSLAEKVIFHIGKVNIRSQKAIEKLGAIKTGEQEIAYFGEPTRPNFIYEMYKKDWKF
jgi:RimJ/RimL family protein N-acetyltransferase